MAPTVMELNSISIRNVNDEGFVIFSAVKSLSPINPNPTHVKHEAISPPMTPRKTPPITSIILSCRRGSSEFSNGISFA